jgi:hypothetical protein
MDNVGSAGDAGFDAALKALDELESNAVPVSAPSSPLSVAIPPILDIFDAVEITPVALVVAAPAGVDDELESMVNASLATVKVPPAEPTPAPISPATSGPVSFSAPSTPAQSGRPWLLAVMIAGLGVFASLLAVIGLIVTSRTMAHASLVVADARERQQQLAKVGVLVHDLELIRARQIELLQRQQVAATTTPLSSEQFNKSMDNLRIDIGKRGPEAEVLQVVRAGQVDSNQRITELTLKVMRIEAAVAGGRRSSLPGGE